MEDELKQLQFEAALLSSVAIDYLMSGDYPEARIYQKLSARKALFVKCLLFGFLVTQKNGLCGP